MNRLSPFLLVFVSWVILCGCNTQSDDNQYIKPSDSSLFIPSEQWHAWWHDGKAELSVYDLVQSRYGELREGTAVLVYVTEPFSSKLHVKSDNPANDPGDIREVLKVNLYRNFVTGIYPYSILNSTFTPIDGGSSLKCNLSCQEWCGHVYSELDLRQEGYHLTGHSYFESESKMDTLFRFSDSKPAFRLEDEIWNLLRFDPLNVLTDTMELVPSLAWLRLMHIEPRPYQAICSVILRKDDPLICRIHYPELERTLEIYVHEVFPHQISGWSETYRDGWYPDSPLLTSTGTLKKSLRTDYWNLHAVSDSLHRKELGL